MRDLEKLKAYLDGLVERYNQPGFIPKDPISIPHRFSRKEDIEIMGFFAATFAWGNRTTILTKCHELIELMGGQPFQCITAHKESDRKRFLAFKHRTFQTTDTLYFMEALQWLYTEKEGLEGAFSEGVRSTDENVANGLIRFHELFFSLSDAPQRTRKHVATPLRKSTCKRLNMFLRWMVRHDKNGVDLGLWKSIRPDQLICPIDTHVNRIARELGLIQRKQTDWLTALELTDTLKQLDPTDPVKYDFALFGLGLEDRKFGGVRL